MKKKSLASMLLALIISANFACSVATAAPTESAPKASSQTTEAGEKAKDESEFPVPNAKAYIIRDAKSGLVISAGNENEKVFPAGLTNIMTAILVLENKSLTDTCVVTEEALKNVRYDQPQFGMEVGEVYTVEELLHAIILNSNNDASNVLAISVSGSIDAFVQKMNQKAKDLGLDGTNFVNPTGLHNESHYTTASDMAFLAEYAMNSQAFATVAAAQKYDFPPTDFRSSTKPILSTNQLVSRYKYPYHYYANATGIKSGNSGEAGYCLAASAKKGDLSLISVVMGAPNTDNQDHAYSFKDTVSMFNYVFENYKSVILVKKGDVLHDSKVKEAKNSTRLALTVDRDIYTTLKKTQDVDIIKNNVNVTKEAEAPIKKGQEFGTVTFSYNGKELAGAKLVAANEVKRDFIIHVINSILGFIFHPIVIIILAAAIYVWVRLRIARNRKRRLRRSKMVSMQGSSAQHRTSSSARRTSGTSGITRGSSSSYRRRH